MTARGGALLANDMHLALRVPNIWYRAALLFPDDQGRERRVEGVMPVSYTHLDVYKRQPYPIVLKIPDGSFSRGVFKVNDRPELLEVAGRLFKSSDLVLAQEFLYTEFDWRVGILNRTPLFVCQYFMSKEHWQIYNHAAGREREAREGDSKTFRVEDAPEIVVKTALKAAGLIGNGFYGVDLKQTTKGVVVIEINDNPSIDHGVEDEVLKEALYRTIIEDFVWRLDRKRGK